MKKVAFIMSVYKNDKLKYFKEAVESIINQDYGFENINIYLGIDGEIGNDIEDYIKSNSHYFYKIIKNETNQGLAYTLNRLIDALDNEEYIFRMDSDDISKLDRVTKQIMYMENNPDIEISGGSIEEIDEDGNIKGIRKYPKDTQSAKRYIPKASIFAHPTVCFRKSFFDKCFRYDKRYTGIEDIALWFVLLENDIQIGNIEDIVLNFRLSKNLYNRRGYAKAFDEFKIYWNGTLKLYGINYRLIYSIMRLITRFMPPSIVKIIYTKNIRKILNYNV